MSAGNKAVELQLQMRQNAEDLQSFMKELDGWERDMKRRDEQLRAGGGGPRDGPQDGPQDGQKTLPPVRNRDYKIKKREKKKPAKTEEAKQTSRIKAYDYRSWDKFDVDKALSAMDKEESPAESNESDSEEAAVDQQRAQAEKEQGNEFFKEGKYDDAIECYTRAMSADPYNPVLPTNRAACFFRLRKFAVAESDCSLALALDRSFLKALSRRGASRLALQRQQAALEDYEAVLQLDPENQEAQSEVRKIKEEEEEEEEEEDEAAAEVTVDPEQQRLMEEQQRRQEAVVQKDRGNAYFKEGRYEAAAECYSRGKEADRLNALLPANRAMAFLKLERFQEAEADCSEAISLDRSYTKAFARRATARVALGKLTEAKQDFQEVLKLEPGNKQALNELQKLQMNPGPAAPPETEPDDAPRRTVQPVHKPPHLQSAKPLRRIEIEEVGGKLLASPLSTSPRAKMIRIEEMPHSAERSAAAGRTEKPSQEKTGPPPEPPAAPSSSQTDVPPPPPPLPPPPPPASSFQLEADLRKIGARPEAVYRYLRQVEPEDFAKIFQNSLEPDLLTQILRTLHGFYTKNEAPAVTLQVLSSLASVRRFNMAVMFLSAPERTVLQELFAFLLQADLDGSSVSALQKKYGV
ncbi:RNA polymerase II-associated protein 3 [Centroberyx affinis]|uniref:RNA polymerase II-associated protein 3 n=1 Tax=Centroberyx affinis TaxID=166261 RepID=UPI003A5C4130